MIVSAKRCDCCLEWGLCAHSGARWLCRSCWNALMDAAWPEKAA